ncbi:hypothetical protein AX16_001797 [Volvariella volvacea WC 439]|nr:hypothetical protein AX16_001797 [Volvariella volvacea WC 439]
MVTASRNSSWSDPIVPESSAGGQNPVASPLEKSVETASTTKPKTPASSPHPSGTPLPIPDVPHVTGYPTRWITESEFEQYLRPLYDLGWGVEFRRRMPEKGKPSSSQHVIAGRVVTEFTFPDYLTAVGFLNEVVGIATKEDHHPNITIANRRHPIIRISSQTDSAYRPVWENEFPQPPRTERKHPGITRRDLRLAALIDAHYAAKYLESTPVNVETAKDSTVTEATAATTTNTFHRGKLRNRSQRPRYDSLVKFFKMYTRHSTSSPETTAPTPTEIAADTDLNKPTKRTRIAPNYNLKCPACNGPHALGRCDMRFTVNPPNPCKLCGGSHWIIDCPNRGTSTKKFTRRNANTTKIDTETTVDVDANKPPVEEGVNFKQLEIPIPVQRKLNMKQERR